MPEWIAGITPQKSKVINLEANFLGSCHPAKKHPNSGVPYKSEKEAYINDMTNTKKSAIYLTFSGPSLLDIGSLTIKSITKVGKKVLIEILEDLKKRNKVERVEVTVKGHSRGALCAKEVYGYLKNIYRNDEVIKICCLNLFDPYAGPFNRFKSSYKNIEFPNTNLGVVYSLSEKRFKSPPNLINANVIIFTDTEHDKTKYIGRIIPNLPKGVYVFLGTQKDLRAITIKLRTASDLREVAAIYEEIDRYIRKHIKLLDSKNCEGVLKLFSKIGSSQRKYIFYKTLMEVDGCKEIVEKYLSERKEHALMKKLGLKSSHKTSSERTFKAPHIPDYETSLKTSSNPNPKAAFKLPSIPANKTPLKITSKHPINPSPQTLPSLGTRTENNRHRSRKNPPITRNIAVQ